MVLLLAFSALSGAAGFMGGYLLGSKCSPPPEIDHTPAEASPPPPPTPTPTPPSPEPEVITPAVPPPAADALPTPPPESEREGASAEPTLRILDGPEAAVKAFLSAPDWESRAKLVLFPERIAPKMKEYHADEEDGPTLATSIQAAGKHSTDDSDSLIVTYLVTTKELPQGIPVAVMKTRAGWKVDWEPFIQFRDDHFRRFATGEGSAQGTFHLLVRNTHFFGAAFPGSDQLTAFRVDPPLPDREQYAFVPTGSDLHKQLAAATQWGHPGAPVLELVRKEHSPGKFHLEVTRIVAPDWKPQE